MSKYALTDLEKIKIENYQYVDLTNKIEFSKLEYETNDEGPCYGPVQSIPLEWNELGQVTVSFFYMEEVPCPDGGSGGTGGNNGGYAGWGGWGDWSGWTSGGTGTGTGGTGTGTGGTGTGTSGTNTGGDPLSEWDGTSIVTYPVIGDGVIIENLNQLTNRPEVKGRITELLGLVSTIQLEHGSEFFTDDDNPTLPLIREDLTPTFSGIIFNSPYSNSLIRLHSHHDPALEPTFSSEDIAGMAIFYRDVKNLGSLEAENVTSILASNLGLYALRITSPQKATLFAQRLDVASYYDQFKLNYGLKVQNKAKDACSCSENNDAYQQFLLNYFIDFLADQDTGISIFTGTINPDGSITWTRT